MDSSVEGNVGSGGTCTNGYGDGFFAMGCVEKIGGLLAKGIVKRLATIARITKKEVEYGVFVDRGTDANAAAVSAGWGSGRVPMALDIVGVGCDGAA